MLFFVTDSIALWTESVGCLWGFFGIWMVQNLQVDMAPGYLEVDCRSWICWRVGKLTNHMKSNSFVSSSVLVSANLTETFSVVTWYHVTRLDGIKLLL